MKVPYLFFMDYGDEGDWLIREAESFADAAAQIPLTLKVRARRIRGYQLDVTWMETLKDQAADGE